MCCQLHHRPNLVPDRGVEPPCLAAQASETCVYAFHQSGINSFVLKNSSNRLFANDNTSVDSCLVGARGLEPPPPYGEQVLSLPRLPVTPRSERVGTPGLNPDVWYAVVYTAPIPICLVRSKGFEPLRGFPHWRLGPARLPLRHDRMNAPFIPVFIQGVVLTFLPLQGVHDCAPCVVGPQNKMPIWTKITGAHGGNRTPTNTV